MIPSRTPRAIAAIAVAAVALTGCQATDLSDMLGAETTAPGQDAAAGAGTIDPAAVAAQLEQIPVAEETDADYDREADYGEGWDTLPNGCDVRNTVLARDMAETELDTDGCTVLAGTLHDAYSGATIDFTRGSAPGESDAVQLDHLIPLSEAHDSGAAEWPQQQREAFAQDMTNLIAVDGPTNNAKGAKDAGQWLPPNDAYLCSYIAGQVQVKAEYGLSMDAAEAQRITEILDHC